MQATTNSIATHAPPSTGQHSPSVKRRASTAGADPRPRPVDGRALPQLGLRGIIAVWAAAALPMGLLAWVVAPLLADQLSGPGALSRALIIALTAGALRRMIPPTSPAPQQPARTRRRTAPHLSPHPCGRPAAT